jgi:ribonucleoside-diphosphate reductase alpha chain
LGRTDFVQVSPEDLRGDSIGKPEQAPEFEEEEVVAENHTGSVPGRTEESHEPAGFRANRVEPAMEKVTTVAGNEVSEQIRIARIKGYEGDPCGTCQQFTMVRNGTCLKCDNCGATSGCS